MTLTGKRLGIAASLYFVLLLLFTWPAWQQAGVAVLADRGDGLVYLWNLWWVNYSVTVLHQHPWYTTYLHFPHGTSLVLHALSVVNGFLAIPLLKLLTLAQTYNVLLLFHFVATGLTTYMLSWELTHRDRASWIAGALVTFSSYHFAHAQGHLQLVAFEGVPLFLYCAIRLMQKPDFKRAAWAALAFLIVLLSDYYYVAYCVMAMVLLWIFRDQKPSVSAPWSSVSRPFALFLFLLALMTVPFYIGIRQATHAGMPSGIHTARIYSLDLLAPFIPGAHWRYAAWTEPLWRMWRAGPHESHVYLGWSVIFLVAYFLRKKFEMKHRHVWLSFLVFFGLMALGPSLHVAGRVLTGIPLPYRVLEGIPLFKLSGTPIRMMSMVILSTALLAGLGFEHFWNQTRSQRFLRAILVGWMLLEFWPAPLPITPLDIPEPIRYLQSQSDKAGVIDTVSDPYWMLYFQTVHEKPLGLGYISRTSVDVQQRDQQVVALYRNGQLKDLAERFGFRYLILTASEASSPVVKHLKVLIEGPIKILDMAP